MVKLRAILLAGALLALLATACMSGAEPRLAGPREAPSASLTATPAPSPAPTSAAAATLAATPASSPTPAPTLAPALSPPAAETVEGERPLAFERIAIRDCVNAKGSYAPPPRGEVRFLVIDSFSRLRELEKEGYPLFGQHFQESDFLDHFLIAAIHPVGSPDDKLEIVEVRVRTPYRGAQKVPTSIIVRAKQTGPEPGRGFAAINAAYCEVVKAEQPPAFPEPPGPFSHWVPGYEGGQLMFRFFAEKELERRPELLTPHPDR